MTNFILVIVVAIFGVAHSQDRGGYDSRSTYDGSRRPFNPAFQPRPYENRPDFRQKNIVNLKSENVNNGDGSYNYFYENNDGTVAGEKGYLKAPRSIDETAIQAAEGFFQYYSPEGQLLRLDYVADENGFQPKGDHLPKPPPIPEAIQKSLDIIYANIEKQKLNSYRKPSDGGYFERRPFSSGQSGNINYRPYGVDQ